MSIVLQLDEILGPAPATEWGALVRYIISGVLLIILILFGIRLLMSITGLRK